MSGFKQDAISWYELMYYVKSAKDHLEALSSYNWQFMLT